MEKNNPNECAPPCNSYNFDDIAKGNLDFSKNQINNNEIIEKMEKLNLNEENNKVILKPRDYQQKIFDKAKNQNSIIYVETGKGKTFISIMLMANFLGIDINNPSSSNKKKNRQKQKNNIFCL